MARSGSEKAQYERKERNKDRAGLNIFPSAISSEMALQRERGRIGIEGGGGEDTKRRGEQAYSFGFRVARAEPELWIL